MPDTYGALTYGDTTYGTAAAAGAYFRIGAQETIADMDFTIEGTGGLGNGDGGPVRGAIVRLMVHNPGEITGQANKTVQVWNSGRFPIPMLNTTIIGPARATPHVPIAQEPNNTYRGLMRNFLNIVAPASGVKRCQVIEVGNEPNGDLGPFLDKLKAVYDLIRARGCEVILGAVVGGGDYTTGGTTWHGPQAVSRAIANGYRGTNWSMIDHFALHNYNQDEGQVVSGLETQRNLFPPSKGMWLTESGWPSPWPGSSNPSWSSPINESTRINKILNFGTALKNRAEALNLRGWSYFAYSDWGSNISPSPPAHFAQMGLAYENGVIKAGGNVTRLPSDRGGNYAPGGRAPVDDHFESSWQALNALPGKTLIGGVVIPPDPTPPEVVTNPATLIQQTSARLNATVDANGISTTWDFEYGTVSGTYTETVTGGTLSGSNPVAVLRTPTTLTADTTYYFRVVATNADGTDLGDEESFTTDAAVSSAPFASTNPQQGVTDTSAVLLGTVNPNGSDTTYRFVYGTSSPPSTNTAVLGTLTGTSPIDVQFSLGGLSAETTYFFRVSATNTAGTTTGGIRSFATTAEPEPPLPEDVVATPGVLLEAIKASHTVAVKVEVLGE